jgi:hypothetical protein
MSPYSFSPFTAFIKLVMSKAQLILREGQSQTPFSAISNQGSNAKLVASAQLNP